MRGRALAAAQADGTAEVETGFGVVRCRLQGAIASGDAVDVLIRPECVAVLTAPPTAGENVWQAAVERVVFVGEYQDTTLRVRGHSLRARVPAWVALQAGQPVYVATPAERCSAIRAE